MVVFRTRVTSKGQSTIPLGIRKFLDIKKEDEVEWHFVKGMVVVEKPRKMKNPTQFLTSQLKLDIDAVKLVRRIREEFI